MRITPFAVAYHFASGSNSAGANSEGLRLINMRSLILSVFLVGTLISFTASSEVLPDDLHSMPVLIEIPLQDKIHSEYGTGIYLSESNKVFLVTAAHCIFNVFSTNKSELINTNAKLSVFIRGKDSTDKHQLDLNLKKLMDDGFVRRHSTHDVTVIQIGIIGTNRFIVWGDAVRSLSTGDFITWDVSESCKTLKDIPDGNETYILGYPVELLNNQVQPEVDFSYPLIRKGIISQRNQRTGKLIIDSGVYGGNSGGPVLVVGHQSLDVTSYKVGGLITQFVPIMTRIAPQIGVTNSNLVSSGYSVAEPIDYALELMRK